MTSALGRSFLARSSPRILSRTRPRILPFSLVCRVERDDHRPRENRERGNEKTGAPGRERQEGGYMARFETLRSSIELLLAIRDRKEEAITSSLRREIVRSTHDDGGKERWERKLANALLRSSRLLPFHSCHRFRRRPSPFSDLAIGSSPLSFSLSLSPRLTAF